MTYFELPHHAELLAETVLVEGLKGDHMLGPCLALVRRAPRQTLSLHVGNRPRRAANLDDAAGLRNLRHQCLSVLTANVCLRQRHRRSPSRSDQRRRHYPTTPEAAGATMLAGDGMTIMRAMADTDRALRLPSKVSDLNG